MIMKKLSNGLELTLYYNSINPTHKPLPYNKVTIMHDVSERMNGKGEGTGRSFGEGATGRRTRDASLGFCFSKGTGDGFGRGFGDGTNNGTGNGFGAGKGVGEGYGEGYGKDHEIEYEEDLCES